MRRKYLLLFPSAIVDYPLCMGLQTSMFYKKTFKTGYFQNQTKLQYLCSCIGQYNYHLANHPSVTWPWHQFDSCHPAICFLTLTSIWLLSFSHLLPDFDLNSTLVIQPSVTWPWHHHFYSLHLAIYFLTLISILLLSTSLLVPDFNMKFVLFNQLPLTWSWHQYYLCQPATSIWLDYQSSVSWPWHQFDLSSSYLFPDLHINLTLVIQPSFTWCWHQFHSFYSTICFLTLTSILFLLILLIFYLVYQYMYSYMYIFHFNSLFFDFLIFVC
jgi:hypothetical protein